MPFECLSFMSMCLCACSSDLNGLASERVVSLRIYVCVWSELAERDP